MEHNLLDPSSLGSADDLAIFGLIVVGITQLVKEAGVIGPWLRVACVLIGSVVWAVMTYLPDVWSQIVALVIALSSTGLVAFADSRLQKLKSSK